MEGIAALIAAALALLSKATSLKDTLRQNGELTPEKEAELDQKISAARSDPAWQVLGVDPNA